MKKIMFLFSVAMLFAMVASAGTVTYNTGAGSSLCLNNAGLAACQAAGTTTQTYANGTIITYLPQITSTVNAITSGNIGQIQISCVGGGTACGLDTVSGATSLVLKININQTVPSVGAGAITTSSITGTIGGTGGSTNLNWSVLSTTIGIVTYSVANNPLTLVPASSNSGITSIQALIVDSPEPGSILLMSAGLAGLLVARRRRS